MLGCLAQFNGIESIIIEKNSRRDMRPKAVMIHSRQLELFDRMGVLDYFLKKGLIQRKIRFQRKDGMEWSIDFSNLDSAFQFYLNITQPDIEEILEKLYVAIGGTLYRHVAYENHYDDGHSVKIQCKRGGVDPVHIESEFLVGCDGGSSAVRKNLGVKFEGYTFQMPYLLGEGIPDTKISSSATSSMLITPNGVVSWLPFPDGRIRIAGPGLITMAETDTELSEKTFQDLQAVLVPGEWPKIPKTDRRAYYRVHSRIAARWGHSRVWLAGDAAHLNPPAGGQALNLGFGDAESIVESIIFSQKEDLSSAFIRYEVERKSVAQSTLKLVDMMPLVQKMANADEITSEAIQDELDKLSVKLSHLYIDYSASGEGILGSDDITTRSSIAVGRRYPWWAQKSKLNSISHKDILLSGQTRLNFSPYLNVDISPDGIVRRITKVNAEVM